MPTRWMGERFAYNIITASASAVNFNDLFFVRSQKTKIKQQANKTAFINWPGSLPT